MKTPVTFLLKIFFLATVFYSCSNQDRGPYAYFQILPGTYRSDILSDTSTLSQNEEIKRLQAGIFLPDLLEKTLHSFHEPGYTPEKIKEDLVTEVLEKTHVVQIRFYCEKEAFSRAFLDSLVKHYINYRNDFLKQENDRETGKIDQELEVIKDSLSVYTDSLQALKKNLPGVIKSYTGEQRTLHEAEKTCFCMRRHKNWCWQPTLKKPMPFGRVVRTCFLKKNFRILQKTIPRSNKGPGTIPHQHGRCHAGQVGSVQKTMTRAAMKNNPGETKVMQLESHLNNCEKHYTVLMEQRVEKAIRAAGRFYFLRMLEPAHYVDPRSKKF